jgi:hypothetical protein
MKMDPLTLVRMISLYGVYDVSLKLGEQGSGELAVGDVLRLHIPSVPGETDEQHLSLEELNDLQSRLMLVASQDEMADGSIEAFVEVCSPLAPVIHLCDDSLHRC